MSQSPKRHVHILHVDDDPDFAGLVAAYLEREDDRFTVETAVSASDGMERLAAGDFDCVISDYAMPGRNGIEFLETVREDYPELPFILFTGRGSEDIAAKAIEAGVDSYQRKQSGTDQYVALANRVRNHVEQHRRWTREESGLRRQRTLIQGILNAIPDVVFAYDDDGNHIVADALLDEFAGYPKEELAEMELLDFLPAENRAVAREHVQRALDGGETVTFETEIVTKDGERIPHEYRAAPMELDGEVLGVAAAARDITDRKEREAELEAKNNRLESFASMLVHELRTPVTTGQIYCQQLPANADAEAVDYVTDAFDRIDDIIDVMLVLTRGNEAVGECTTVDLAAVAREAWEEVDAPHATLDVAIDSEIEAHETYVRHLFRNLFENAVEHGSTGSRSQAHENAVEHSSTSPRSGTREDAVEHGSTSPRPGDENVDERSSSGRETESHDALERGRRDVTVTVGELPSGFYVADDGSGIATEDYDAVFEEGYTTAADGGGAGLGLAFVNRLIEGYDWACTVTESEAGGARFEFRNGD